MPTAVLPRCRLAFSVPLLIFSWLLTATQFIATQFIATQFIPTQCSGEERTPAAESSKYPASIYESLSSDEYGRDDRGAYRASYEPDGIYRQPIDVEFVNAQRALVTTKLTGHIYELDLVAGRVAVVYHDPLRSWGRVIRLREDVVAVADRNHEQVVLLCKRDGHWSSTGKLDAAGQPQSLVWDEAAQTLYATGLWSQRLYRWKLESTDEASHPNWIAGAPIDLGMSGGEILLLPRHNLVLVTDAFGRNYRLLSKESGEIVKSDKVYGHNITSLRSVAGEDMVLFPHQLLNEYAQSLQGEITWGGLMSNNLRWLKVERLLNKTGQDIFRQGRFYPLGVTGNGSGDPTCLQVSSSGQMAVTLGGINRVAIGDEDDYYFKQFDVGYHPVACKFSPDEQTLVVVNQFSDSLSLVDLQQESVTHLTLGKLREPTAEERGEQAFFNSRLSHDGWMSCHSCHSQGHTSGQLNDNLTDHSFGTPKRVLSLLGQAKTNPYSWGGSLPTLEQQISHSIASTMASDHPVSQQNVQDLAAFVRALNAPPSVVEARRLKAERTSRFKSRAAHDPAGERLFATLGCADCHAGKWLTNREAFDVGIEDENGMRLFNPPSLVGVSQRQDVLFHDGRASSLREVLEKHLHQLPRELSSEELSQLVEFLESL